MKNTDLIVALLFGLATLTNCNKLNSVEVPSSLCFQIFRTPVATPPTLDLLGKGHGPTFADNGHFNLSRIGHIGHNLLADIK